MAYQVRVIAKTTTILGRCDFLVVFLFRLFSVLVTRMVGLLWFVAHLLDLLLVVEPVCHLKSNLLVLDHRAGQLGWGIVACNSSNTSMERAGNIILNGLHVTLCDWPILHVIGSQLIHVIDSNRIAAADWVLIQDGSDASLTLSDMRCCEISLLIRNVALVLDTDTNFASDLWCATTANDTRLLWCQFALAFLSYSWRYGRHLKLFSAFKSLVSTTVSVNNFARLAISVLVWIFEPRIHAWLCIDAFWKHIDWILRWACRLTSLL